jgi:hypothetical protein
VLTHADVCVLARYRRLLARREQLREEAHAFEGELPRVMDEALVEVATSIEQANRQIRKINILTRGGVLTREGCPTGASASEEVRSRMLTYADAC